MAKGTKDEELSEAREHWRAARRAWRESWEALLPERFVEKTKEGRREALLALRSLIDVAIDRLEGEDDPRPRPKRKVKVEPTE